MTTMPTVSQPAKKPCHCGCHQPKEECCELECLVQPRFFCGQLLTDQDLTAMVGWIKQKTGLARYRDGWGVVCGLGVRAEKNGSVTVTSGYALDCCGRDVVVCKDTPFDLTKQCWNGPPGDCTPSKPGAPNAAVKLFDGKVNPKIPAAEVRVFDLCIRYSESPSDARNALARGSCGSEPGCEYSRVHEGSELYCRGVEEPNKDPRQEQEDQWFADYAEWVFSPLKGQPQTMDGLRAAITQRPLQTFPFVHEWIDAQAPPPAQAHDYPELNFWAVQDWRLQYLSRNCMGCGPDMCVPLARIWMRRSEQNIFSIQYINAHSPYRRTLSRDEWPAGPGRRNLASYIWQPADSVCFDNVTRTPFDFNKQMEELRKPASLIVPCARPDLFLYTYRDPQTEMERIVSFGLHL